MRRLRKIGCKIFYRNEYKLKEKTSQTLQIGERKNKEDRIEKEKQRRRKEGRKGRKYDIIEIEMF